MVKDSPTIEQAMPHLLSFIGDAIIVAHHAQFDKGFLNFKLYTMGHSISNNIADTLRMCRIALPELQNHKLLTICNHYGISIENQYRATDDAIACAEILLNLITVHASNV